MTDVQQEARKQFGQVTESEFRARATALEEIRQMHDDLRVANEDIASLTRDLEREQDRRALLVADRERYMQEAILFRTKLVELATSVSNIGLLTIAAQDIMKSVGELLGTNSADETTTLHAVADGIEGHNNEAEERDQTHG